MAQAILRKMLADIRSHRFQLGMIFLVLSLAAMLLTVAIIVQNSSADPWERTFEEANGPHVWLVLPDAELDPSVIEELPEVTETGGVLPVLTRNPIVVEGEQHELYLYGMTERPSVARPVMVEGRWMAETASDEIVLEYSLAKYFEIARGDTVEILTGEGIRELEVVGLAINPNWISYTENTAGIVAGTGYINDITLQTVEPDSAEWAGGIGIRIQNPDEVAAFQDKLYAIPGLHIESAVDWMWLRDMNTITTTIVALVMSMLSILGIVSVGFIIASTISGQMLSQYREIGILKATGFQPHQVMLLFLLEHLAIAFLAGIAGVIPGIFLAAQITGPIAELVNQPPPEMSLLLVIPVVLLVVMGSVMVFTLVPAWRASRINTVQAISIGYLNKRSALSRPASMAMRLGLPAVVVMGVKDIFARPMRTGLAIMGLMVTITVIVFAIGADASITNLSENAFYYHGTAGDMTINRNFVPDEDVQNLLAEYPEVEAVYTSRLAFGQFEGTDGVRTPLYSRALAGELDTFELEAVEGRFFEIPGEVVAGYGLVDKMDVEIGDIITVSVEGRPFEVEIVGLYSEGTATGNTLLYSLETYREQINPDGEPQIYNLKLAPGTDAEVLASEFAAISDNQFDIRVISSEPNAISLQLRDMARAVSGLLLLVAIVNLMSTAMLDVREHLREYGIQKAIGFTPGQIIQTVIVNVCLLVILALLTGLPFALWFYAGFTEVIGQQIGAGPLFGDMDYLNLFLLLPGLLAVAIISSLLPAGHAARTEVVEVLRYE